jgi:hypothetical protein
LVANSATLTQRSPSNKPKRIDASEIIDIVKNVREPFQSKDPHLIALKQSRDDLFSFSKSIQFETVTLREASYLHTHPQDDSVNGKALNCIKILCFVFGISDMNFNVARNTFLVNARELIVKKIEGNAIDSALILIRLKQKESEFRSVFQSNAHIEFSNLFDTFLPCILNNGANSKIFQGKHIFISVIITILYFIGGCFFLNVDSCHSVVPVGDAYKKLGSSKDFPAVILQVRLRNV